MRTTFQDLVSAAWFAIDGGTLNRAECRSTPITASSSGWYGQNIKTVCHDGPIPAGGRMVNGARLLWKMTPLPTAYAKRRTVAP